MSVHQNPRSRQTGSCIVELHRSAENRCDADELWNCMLCLSVMCFVSCSTAKTEVADIRLMLFLFLIYTLFTFLDFL